jgi:hypothetical protein
MRARDLSLLTLCALALGCATYAPSASAAQSACDTGDVAPAQLVVAGDYSDARFVDMMAAHHAMAIAMAQDEVQRGKRSELVELARGIITSQGAEIDKLRQLKQQECGTSHVTLRVNPVEDENSGMVDQLPQQNVDLARTERCREHGISPETPSPSRLLLSSPCSALTPCTAYSPRNSATVRPNASVPRAIAAPARPPSTAWPSASWRSTTFSPTCPRRA